MELLTVLSSAIGFAGSALPSVFDIFKQKMRNKQELEILKFKGMLAEQKVNLELLVYETKAADNEHARLISHDQSMSDDNGFIGALRKSVRPVITYCLFSLFVSVKVTTLVYAYNSSGDFLTAINVIWDADTKAIFAAIMSFWFGQRMFAKANRTYINAN